jgi:hypothetical protein
MKNTHPVEVLLLGAWLALEAAARLLTALVALLLTLAGWRPPFPEQESRLPKRVMPPRPAPPVTATSRLPAVTPTSQCRLEPLTVSELRRLARAAGLRQLGRSGRRADLLQALAATG